MRWLVVLGLFAACGRVDFEVARDSSDAADSGAQGDSTPVPGCDDGLVGWWRFDDASGTTAIDSAAGHTGTLVGGASWTTGHIGSAIALDGLDDDVDIDGTVAYATQAAPFSLSAWVVIAAYTPGVASDLMEMRSDTATPFHVIVSNGSGYEGVSVGSLGTWATIKTGVEPSIGEWHHVAVTYDGITAGSMADFQIFLDGVSQPLLAAGAYDNIAQHSRIGASEQGNYWSGTIDEVRVYDRALSATDVSGLFTATCD